MRGLPAGRGTLDRRERGSRAERLVERMLRRAGLVILARNWRGGGGELDLAALEGETLVFVEVKSRSSAFLPGKPPVSASQRRRIARAARAFRGRYGVRHLPLRFDLVTIAGGEVDGTGLAWHKGYQTPTERA